MQGPYLDVENGVRLVRSNAWGTPRMRYRCLQVNRRGGASRGGQSGTNDVRQFTGFEGLCDIAFNSQRLCL